MCVVTKENKIRNKINKSGTGTIGYSYKGSEVLNLCEIGKEWTERDSNLRPPA